MNLNNPTEDDWQRSWLLNDSLFFTRYFFHEITGKRFIIGNHHRLIADKLNQILTGEHPTNHLIINIAPRYGKAIDVETPMLTTDGWKRAGDIKPGDRLYGKDGKPTKVVAVYPQGVTDAYHVTFTDNTSLVTCGEHLWWAYRRRRHQAPGYTGEIVKTSDMAHDLFDTDGHHRWHIPSAEPLQTEERQLDIEPYLLGCWLGDGASYKAEITTMDDEIISAFEHYGVTIRTHQNAGKATEYGIRGGFIGKLKRMGLVGNKRIPTEYLLASESQRRELLAGLSDTDGTCNRKNGQTSICLTNDELRQDLKTLLASLGIYYTEYRMSVFFRADFCPFKLKRKAQYWKPLNKHHFTKRFVHSIEKVERRETICFEVDNLDHLYLAGRDLVVTHNTEVAVKNFIAAGLALNPKSRFIHLSYSGTLAQDNSISIKNILNTDEYRRLFATRIKFGSDTKSRWDTEQGGGVYATSTLGQITGFGAGEVDDIDENGNPKPYKFAGAIVIDDPIKPEDALSDVMRENVNRRFETTIRNRVNSRNTPIIIIMQRLHEMDLCGYLQKLEPDVWDVLSLPCIQENQETGQSEPLWPFKHTMDELRKIEEANSFVFDTQYMQNPTPLEGLMYQRFKTYETMPIEAHLPVKKNYTDTADTGADFLCSICYDEFEQGMFVTDILYTDKPMEYTEPETARMADRAGTQEMLVESNNGGRGFARNVEKNLRSLGNKQCSVSWFTQTSNKLSRIFSHSAEVQNLIYFPVDWESRWPKFANAMKSCRKNGNNAHDDAPDACTGMCENFQTFSAMTDAELEEMEDIIYEDL
ncbi:MAG: phage terminase large subunit [Fibrobacter sp.]|nr:phage terminase large subunit [Fibrobacter sp.]